MRALALLILIPVLTNAQGAGKQPTRVKLIRSPKAVALAHAFHTGKLPEPLRMPAGNVDQQATALAKAVATGDDSSIAALYAAVLASGYGVRDIDKSVMQTTENGQGLVLASWQVAAAAKLYGEDYGVTLAHLSNSFTQTVPALKSMPIADAILDGIRKAAKSNHPAVRFWAQFIVALGKQSAAPYDLLTQVDPAKTRLDAIQVAFILSRLSGEFAVIEKRTAAHHPRLRSESFQSSCGGASDVEDLINDYDALEQTTLFDIITERLGGKAATYGKVAGVANVVLTVFKFIVSYASLEVEITMDGDKLIRTKTTTPGERRLLTATLKMDTSKWDMINCLRPTLNKVGLDVDIPKSGPLAGVNAVWVIVLGGDSRGWLGTVEDMLNIFSGETSYGDGVVFLEAVPGANRSADKQYTNKEGVSQIYVVGAPQETDLSKRKLFEVDKGAGVRVDVQLKSMRIVDTTQAVSNIMDIAEDALSFLTSDYLGGVVDTAAETLYRSNWYGSQPFYFIVKDWEPCKGQWIGTITYTSTLKDVGSAQDFRTERTWNDEATYEATAQLDGRRDNLGAPMARVKARAHERTERFSTGKVGCFYAITKIQELNGSETVDTSGSFVYMNPRSGKYQVHFPAILVSASGTASVDAVVKGTCNNPYNKDNHEKSAVSMRLSGEGPGLEGGGTIDPNNPDVLSGSDTVTVKTTKGVRTATITWNLRRCQDQ